MVTLWFGEHLVRIVARPIVERDGGIGERQISAAVPRDRVDDQRRRREWVADGGLGDGAAVARTQPPGASEPVAGLGSEITVCYESGIRRYVELTPGEDR
ncbi:hypothetical protein [Haloarcula nitratireducens]|uniref:Uncharacterized protein n=1 Tax=Haloarcula nitratireducens TaxID=2487749 RepID=A0AAW4P6Z1_9EURY|nr:hypothetical protein [Halomicroarcula nitratireducens]MBX0293516.1 hypothetical protein [Halomicroarcula nitratireducens]